MILDALKAFYILAAFCFMLVLTANLIYNKRYEIYRPLSILFVFTIYVFISIIINKTITLSSSSFLLLILCEELTKFFGCKIMSMERPIIWMSIGALFGSIEIALAKSQLVFFYVPDQNTLFVFSLFSAIAMLMHSVTPLYFYLTRYSIFNIFLAFCIHIFSNLVALQSNDDNWKSIAAIQISFVAFAAFLFFSFFKKGISVSRPTTPELPDQPPL
jgi:hypothetical protein